MTPEILAHNAWLFFVGYPLFGLMLVFIVVRDAADWIVERLVDATVWTAGDRLGHLLEAELRSESPEDRDDARES